jgi:hypothetical protein
MNIHAVVGTGSAPEEAVQAALGDIVKEGDAIAIAWDGPPKSAGVKAVYDYVLDNEIEFVMLHAAGDKVPSVFSSQEFGVTEASDDLVESLVASVEGEGTVLYLWDDDVDTVSRVLELAGDKRVLDLTDALTPIMFDDTPEAPELVEAPEEEEDDMSFTRDELEAMAAVAVKRYGAKKGCKAATKGGIIAELFPDDESAPEEVQADEQPEEVEEIDPTDDAPAESPRVHPIYRSLTNVTPTPVKIEVIEDLRNQAKFLADEILALVPDSRERSLALTHLEEVVMWAVKGIVLYESDR